jgi:hypothetical protein
VKKLWLLVLVLFILSCSDRTTVKINTLDCKVIDTVYVSRNGFNDILEYTAIIKIDSCYYGASQNLEGNITEISGKLNHIKSK